jgi:BirA family biotin operon repressor/biotin-[acetyl-CoA-carboxylase] ligase
MKTKPKISQGALKTTPAALRREHTLATLADGAFHSGEAIAEQLHLSRSAVWKQIRSLQALGIEIQAVPKQGYRLPRAVDLYDAEKIVAQWPEAVRRRVTHMDVLLEVDSTNSHIDQISGPAPGHATLCVAEVQTAGRGRKGRSWVAPFGGSLCLSLGWQFGESPPTLSALSLAVGIAVVRVLRRLGASAAALKWPNDVLWQGRKLAGVLIEMRGESAGPARVVIGIGLNIHIPGSIRVSLAGQQALLVADLQEILRERLPERNTLAAALVEELVTMLQIFARRGFEAFAAEWRSIDALVGAPVKIMTGTQTILGIARGVDVDGALLLDVNGTVQRIVSGDVSVRPIKPAGPQGGRPA